MTIIIEGSRSHFGDAYIVTATLDKYHRTLVREFFCYADAYSFCCELLINPLEPEFQALFKRKGL